MRSILYDNYKNTKAGFDTFNKLVINMPRHEFRIMNIKFVKSLAMILANIKYDDSERLTIIELYYLVHIFLINNPGAKEHIFPFVYQIFDLDLNTKESILNYYNTNDGDARNFRHLVEIMRLWGLIDEDPEVSNKINYDVCNEFFALKDDEIEVLRTKMIGMDIVDNSFFIKLKNISSKIRNNTIFSYKPATAIIKYINEIGRPVSKFELANLLAIVTPDCNDPYKLYENALEIGKQMPSDISKHQEWFFDYMNWKDENNNYFVYRNSQAPHFKFNTFTLFLKDLGFVNELEDESIVLTEYSINLLKEDIPMEIVELEKYLEIAETSYTDKELADLILHNTKPSVFKTILQSDEIIKCFNRRVLAHPRYDRNGKKMRNKLLAELSKARLDYNCQIGGIPPFKDYRGNNYVESHHIIEFNREDGPDIIDNLLVINPYYHELIHHAGEEDLTKFFSMLREKEIVTIDMFKKMIDDYGCLEKKHFISLLKKKLINREEFDDLVNYLNDSGEAISNAIVVRV